jgi:rod shape-determining protein MreD
MVSTGTRSWKGLEVTDDYRNYLKVNGYTVLLFLAQVVWVSRLPHPVLRVDLLLPLMFAAGHRGLPLQALVFALAWGFVMDVFSGTFWGLHVSAYLLTVCLVILIQVRVELTHLAYQVLFVGGCALLQSVMIGVYLMVHTMPVQPGGPFWESLLGRALITMILAPLINAPVMKMSWGQD